MLRDLNPYEKVDARFVVKFKKPIQDYAKGFSFQLRVGDASGETMLRYWGPNNKNAVEKIFKSIKPDDVVNVVGETAVYNDQIMININPPGGGISILEPGEYDPGEFLPKTEKDVDEMFNELSDIVNTLEDEKLKSLINSYLNDPEFEKEFKKAPAAMYLHHGWLGGLLEHTLNVMKICDNTCMIHKELRRDLTLTGAFFHDLGKMEEFKVTSNIKTSKEGMLIGHVIIVLEKLNERMKELDIDKDMQLKIKHIIISHHGRKEYGTPKEPAIPEALVVYYADDMDAKTTEMITRIKTAQTDDEYMYIHSMGRNVYLK